MTNLLLLRWLGLSALKLEPFGLGDDIVRREMVDNFAKRFPELVRSTSKRNATVLSKTLSDILAKPPLATLAKAVAFVGVDATIATARTKLQSVAGSNDVFVTATGDGTERVVGWLTNSLLASSS